jgi:hypothetical protein
MSEVLMHPWTNKGHDAPVDNYLPHRAPLTLPVDMEVVRGMTGFEFGSEEDIKAQIEDIISSPEYQNAAKIISRNSTDQINSGIHNRSRHHLHHGIKKPFQMPIDDPQSIPAAYHPLISIYYLVKERMERNRLTEQQESYEMILNTGDESRRRTSRDILTGVQMPTISKPERAHPADQTYEQSVLHTNEGDGLSGIAYGRRGRANIRLDPDGHIVEIDGHSVGDKIEEGFNKLFSRRHTGNAHNSFTDSPEIEKSHENDHPGVFRRLSLALGKGDSAGRRHERHHSLSRRQDDPASPIPIPGTSPDLDPRSRFISRSIPEETTRKASDNYGHPFSSLLHRVTAEKDSDRATASHQSGTYGREVIGGKKLASGKVPAQELPTVDLEPSAMNSGSGPAPKSSKSASETTSHRRQSGRRSSTYSYDRHDVQSVENGTVDQSIRPVFLKGLFSVTTTSTKHPSVIRADLIHVLERIGVKWRESKGRFECVHVPSIDLYGQQQRDLLPVHEEEATAGHSENGRKEFTRGRTAVDIPDLVVRFEIYIVKVPWLLGMHGLQFRRVGGDPWQYKNMCSKILNELKL